MIKNDLILWYSQVNNKDVSLVGGKNASLGEMYNELKPKGVNLVNGFCITAHAYREFIKYNEITQKINDILNNLKNKKHKLKDIQNAGKKIRTLILKSKFPKNLENEIIKNYKKLSKYYKEKNVDVAVRSSATAEDLPSASFAGQLESYLNIKGKKELLLTIKKCFSSLFTDRVISYRMDKGFVENKIAISVGILKMVRSDKACSGVMFSIDSESGFKNSVLINGSYGLGENIVKGKVNPDEYFIFKPLINKSKLPILRKSLGNKSIKLIYDKNNSTKNIKTTKQEQSKYCLNDKEVIKLASWAIEIEKHYTKKNKRYTPMDIEWAKDGINNKLYIVQARPETIHSNEDKSVSKHYILKEKGKIITKGSSVGMKIGQGRANIILNPKDINKFKKGDVLVTDVTDPDWEPIMKMASAIVTNKGGRTSHAAIISRELGIAAIVGTNNATKVIKNKQKITVSCSQGDEGFVYDGLLKYNIEKIDISNIKIPKHTKILMNLGNPDVAYSYSSLPIQGIGLAREEFIISSFIKIHPLALINYKKMPNGVKKQIDKIVKTKNKTEFYVNQLASGIAMLASSVWPNEIIIRFSDFKTNEYSKLIGGEIFEPHEQNPMLGFRGASRYYSDTFKEAFKLECKAIKYVRNIIELNNVKVMVPFCRTIEEAKNVLNILKEEKLISNILANRRKSKELKVYVMAEIPSNIILADEFSKYFDGFSIGTNDLTQLTLGVDRDSQLLAHLYNENNPAVRTLVKQIIQIAHKNKKKVGICGDAPSTKPDFAKFLINNKIDSISLSPDAVVRIIKYLKKQTNKSRKN